MFSDPQYRGVFAALIREGSVFVEADGRLLLEALDALDARVRELEHDVAGSNADTV